MGQRKFHQKFIVLETNYQSNPCKVCIIHFLLLEIIPEILDNSNYPR